MKGSLKRSSRGRCAWLFQFPVDTGRAEAGEERREVNRGMGEQGAVVQEEFLGENTGCCYVLGEKLGFHIKLLI